MTAHALSLKQPTQPIPSSAHGDLFEAVQEAVHRRADLALPDQVVEASDLHATDEGEVEVPNLGVLSLTDWSVRQLGTIVGVRWAKWFSDDLVAPEEKAEELNRRFARITDRFRIRARRYAPEESGGEEGVLRAFVGPGYAPTDDREVFDGLGRTLGSRVSELQFVRTSVTESSSQFAAVSSESVDLGVEVPDGHKTGFVIANSEVGARALSIQVFVERLVCTNGLVVADSRLLHWIHRARKVNDFEAKLRGALALLPEKWQRGMRLLEAARGTLVTEPEDHIRGVLAADPVTRKHTETVVTAFAEEPEATLFGVVQAMTRAARGLPPEDRLALEEFAGRHLAGSAAS